MFRISQDVTQPWDEGLDFGKLCSSTNFASETFRTWKF